MSAIEMFKVGDSEDESAAAEELEREGIRRVWYHYKAGAYDGGGAAVFQRDGRWNETNLGHCSCYGPWEHLPTKESDVDTIDELQAKCSTAYYESMAPLFAAARAAHLPA